MKAFGPSLHWAPLYGNSELPHMRQICHTEFTKKRENTDFIVMYLFSY